MKSTKVYSTGLKDLRLRLGIKRPPPQAEMEKRVAEFTQRVDWVVQKSNKRSESGDPGGRGPLYRWTPEEDQKLRKLRASGLEWTSIAKELHRTPRAVENRFLRLLAKRIWP